MNYATPDLKALTSTPGPLADNIHPMSDMFRISSSGSERQADDSNAHISGIEELQSRRRSHLKESSSFINPFELTIDITEVESNNCDSDDDDYEPSLNITFGEADDTRNIIEEDEEDEIYDDEPEQTDFYSGPGVKRIDSDKEVEDFLADILILNTWFKGNSCVMVCPNGHIVHKWCSQPILNRGMHSGDMIIAASVVLSGSNFQKISMFASVDESWIDHQDAI
ncbi:unnamed protein product [Mytilus coruscus]|uniref:Uncharacterized protein n=1 Tax=Mytilus coruscus TaxID=42192 RepID=A0A6J8F3D7_MYTCO|nr:unnamed protein product [Mytilus coruscus]